MRRELQLTALVACSLAPLAAPAFAQGAPAPASTAPTAAGAAPSVSAPATVPAPVSTAPTEGPLASGGKIGLQQAIDLAVRRSFRVDIAQQEIVRAQALTREARAASFPTLDGNAQYTRLDSNRVFNNRTVAGIDQISANVTLAVPLFAPQRWARWSFAKDQIDLSRLDAQEVRRQIASSVAYAYLTVIAQHRAGEAAQRALDSSQAHYDYAHKRLEGGLGNRLDDVRAAQELAASEAQLAATREGLARAQEALGVLLGIDGAIDVVDDVTLPELPKLADGLAHATEAREDVRVSEARVRLAKRTQDANWTDYMPLLRAQFQPFYQNPASITAPNTGWQAQLILSVPLYDGGLRYGLAEERAAAVAERRTERDQLLRQVRSEVRVAFVAVESADAKWVAADKASKLATEAVDMANLAYKAGATSNLEVIDAERRARDAAIIAVLAEDDAHRARVELLVATGKLP